MNSQHPIAISLQDVGVRYQSDRKLRGQQGNTFWALSRININLGEGEKLGVIGRNGAGKSTLLRVLAGVFKPDSGRVQRNHGRCRLLAYGTGFMPDLTGRENAVLSGLLMGMRRQEIIPRLDEVKAFAELGDFFEQPVRTYSTGMRARLGFSVAIQQQLDVLLIDETLAVGDAAFQVKAVDALRERIRGNTTVVLVSHDAKTIENTCDRVIWLDHGSIIETGKADDLLRKYHRGTGA